MQVVLTRLALSPWRCFAGRCPVVARVTGWTVLTNWFAEVVLESFAATFEAKPAGISVLSYRAIFTLGLTLIRIFSRDAYFALVADVAVSTVLAQSTLLARFC